MKDMDFVQGAFSATKGTKETFKGLMSKYYNGGTKPFPDNALTAGRGSSFYPPALIPTYEPSSALREMIESEEFTDFITSQDDVEESFWLRTLPGGGCDPVEDSSSSTSQAVILSTTLLGGAAFLLFLQKRKFVDSFLLRKALEKTETATEVVFETTAQVATYSKEKALKLKDAVFCEQCLAKWGERVEDGTKKVRETTDLTLELLNKGAVVGKEVVELKMQQATNMCFIVLERSKAVVVPLTPEWSLQFLNMVVQNLNGSAGTVYNFFEGSCNTVRGVGIDIVERMKGLELQHVKEMPERLIVFLTNGIMLVYERSCGVILIIKENVVAATYRMTEGGSSENMSASVTEAMSKSWYAVGGTTGGFFGGYFSAFASMDVAADNNGRFPYVGGAESKDDTDGSTGSLTEGAQEQQAPARAWNFFGGNGPVPMSGSGSSESPRRAESNDSSNEVKSQSSGKNSSWIGGWWKTRNNDEENVEFKNTNNSGEGWTVLE